MPDPLDVLQQGMPGGVGLSPPAELDPRGMQEFPAPELAPEVAVTADPDKFLEFAAWPEVSEFFSDPKNAGFLGNDIRVAGVPVKWSPEEKKWNPLEVDPEGAVAPFDPEVGPRRPHPLEDPLRAGAIARGELTPDGEITPRGRAVMREGEMIDDRREFQANLALVRDPAMRAELEGWWNRGGLINPDLSRTEDGVIFGMELTTALHEGRETFNRWYDLGAWQIHQDRIHPDGFFKTLGKSVAHLGGEVLPDMAKGLSAQVVGHTPLVNVAAWFGQWQLAPPELRMVYHRLKQAGAATDRTVSEMADVVRARAKDVSGAMAGEIGREAMRNQVMMANGWKLWQAWNAKKISDNRAEMFEGGDAGYKETLSIIERPFFKSQEQRHEEYMTALFDYEDGMWQLDQLTADDAVATVYAFMHSLEKDDAGAMRSAERGGAWSKEKRAKFTPEELGEKEYPEGDPRRGQTTIDRMGRGVGMIATDLSIPATFTAGFGLKMTAVVGRGSTSVVVKMQRELAEAVAMRKATKAGAGPYYAAQRAVPAPRPTAIAQLDKTIVELQGAIARIEQRAGMGALRDTVRASGAAIAQFVRNNKFSAGLISWAEAAEAQLLKLGNVRAIRNLPMAGMVFSGLAGNKVSALLFAAAAVPGKMRMIRGAMETAHGLGAEFLKRRGSSPYWARVSERFNANPILANSATALDAIAKPIVVGGKMGNALKNATFAESPFSMIASGGQEGWFAEAVAEALLFGGPGIAHAGMREAHGIIAGLAGIPTIARIPEFNALALNDALELRRTLPTEDQRTQFDRLPPGIRRVIGVYSALMPDLSFRFDPGSGGGRYHRKVVTIDPLSKNPLGPLLAHEVAHSLHDRGMFQLVIDELVGDRGHLRKSDGSLTDDAKEFKKLYEARLKETISDEQLAFEWFAESVAPGLLQLPKLQALIGRNRWARGLVDAALPRIPFGKKLMLRAGVLLDNQGNPIKGEGSMAAFEQSPVLARAAEAYLRANAGRSAGAVAIKPSPAKKETYTAEELKRGDEENIVDFEWEDDGFGNLQQKVDRHGRPLGLDPEVFKARKTAVQNIFERTAARHSVEGIPERTGKTYKFNREQWNEILADIEKTGWYNSEQIAHMRIIVDDLVTGEGVPHIVHYHPVYTTRRDGSKVVLRKGRPAKKIAAAFYDVIVSEAGNVNIRLIDLDVLESNAVRAAETSIGRELYPGGFADIMHAVTQLADNHRAGRPNDAALGRKQRNFLNGLMGQLSKEHIANNPIFGGPVFSSFKKKHQAIRTYRFDRTNRINRSPAESLPFRHSKWVENLLPEPLDPNIRRMPEPVDTGGRVDPDGTRTDPLPAVDPSTGTETGGLPRPLTGDVGRDQGWVPPPDGPYPPTTAPALRGLPQSIEIEPGRTVEFGPYEPARQAALDYTREAGLPYDPPGDYAKVDPDRATHIADEFEAMEHQPNDPEVKAAYAAMMTETHAQYEIVKKTGLKIEPIPIEMGDPYGNPRFAILDVVENNHFWFFPSKDGFGTTGDVAVAHAVEGREQGPDVTDNPLLEETGEVINGYRMTWNDEFRVVHDYFGHIKEGVGFRAFGEENAWRSHSAMYGPLARRAMTVETRGQNSWINYGPHKEHNTGASAATTQYAPQKVGLLPDWVTREGARDSAPRLTEPVTESFNEVFEMDLAQVSRRNMEEVADEIEGTARRILEESGVDPSKMTPEQIIDYVVERSTAEVAHVMDEPGSGKQWYSGDIRFMDNALREIFPTGLKTKAQRVIYKGILALTSFGNKAYSNFIASMRLFTESGADVANLKPLQADGKGWTQRKRATELGLQRLNQLVGDKGVRRAATWLLSNHPVSELREYNPGVRGRRDAMKRGALILGPKGGPFFLNLNGIQQFLTMDLWFSRSWNRILGTLLLPKPEQQFNVRGEPVGYTHTWDTPRNDAERRAMEEVVTRAAANLDLTVAEFQAVWWIYEQKLYTLFGIPSESGSFKQAAQRVLRGAGFKSIKALRDRRASEEGGKDADFQSLAEGATDIHRQPEPLDAPTTPAFKEWFAESKVVDEAGKPMMVYHTTPEKFDVFKPGGKDPTESGPAIWLAYLPDEIPAWGLGKSRVSDPVMGLYARAENPLQLEHNRQPENQKKWGTQDGRFLTADSVARIKAAGYDSIITTPGMPHYARFHPKEGRELVVFDSNQLKSATENRGTYDPSDPNIRRMPEPTIVPHSQSGHSFTVDLNGNKSLPVTKSGKVSVLRSHSIYVDGKLTKRILTQDQVKQVKQSGEYISQSDRDWTHRNKGRTVTLISPDELSSLTEQGDPDIRRMPEPTEPTTPWWAPTDQRSDFLGIDDINKDADGRGYHVIFQDGTRDYFTFEMMEAAGGSPSVRAAARFATARKKSGVVEGVSAPFQQMTGEQRRLAESLFKDSSGDVATADLRTINEIHTFPLGYAVEFKEAGQNALWVPTYEVNAEGLTGDKAGVRDLVTSRDRRLREETEKKTKETEEAILHPAPPVTLKIDKMGFRLQHPLEKKVQGKRIAKDQLRALIKPDKGMVGKEEAKWLRIDELIDELADEKGKVPTKEFFEGVRERANEFFQEYKFGKEAAANVTVGTVMSQTLWMETTADRVRLPEGADSTPALNILTGSFPPETKVWLGGHPEHLGDTKLLVIQKGPEAFMAFYGGEQAGTRLTLEFAKQELAKKTRVRLVEDEKTGKGFVGGSTNFGHHMKTGDNYRELMLVARGIHVWADHPTVHSYDRSDLRNELDDKRIAGALISDRTNLAGETGTMMEEVQSDRHQKGHNEGYWKRKSFTNAERQAINELSDLIKTELLPRKEATKSADTYAVDHLQLLVTQKKRAIRKVYDHFRAEKVDQGGDPGAHYPDAQKILIRGIAEIKKDPEVVAAEEKMARTTKANLAAIREHDRAQTKLRLLARSKIYIEGKGKEKRSGLVEKGSEAVPDAPLSNPAQWFTAILKRVLRDAVDEDQPWVGWWKGSVVNTRWSLTQAGVTEARWDGTTLEYHHVDHGWTTQDVAEHDLGGTIGDGLADQLIEQLGEINQEKQQWIKDHWQESQFDLITKAIADTDPGPSFFKDDLAQATDRARKDWVVNNETEFVAVEQSGRWFIDTPTGPVRDFTGAKVWYDTKAETEFDRKEATNEAAEENISSRSEEIHAEASESFRDEAERDHRFKDEAELDAEEKAEQMFDSQAHADSAQIDAAAVDLRYYYDVAFPNGARKFLKRWKGVELEQDTETNGDDFWKFDITPEMAKDIKENGFTPW